MAGLDLGRAWLGVLALFVSVSALAETDPALLKAGWRDVRFDGKTPNRFETFDDGGVTVITAESVSVLEKSVSVDLDEKPVLAWRWRVDRAAPPTDLAIKGEDDRSLALYVAFPFQPEQASLFERMRRAVVEAVAGSNAPGRVLVYVWGGDGQVGERVRSPHLGDAGMMTILRPADTPSGTWFAERVDIAADYRRVFASEPPDPLWIAISADTDDTRTASRGTITDLAFTRASGDS